MSLDVQQYFPATLELVLLSGLILVCGTFTLGLLSAKHQNTWIDGFIRIGSYIGIAIPSFVVGVLLLLLFGYEFQVIPVLGRLSSNLNPPTTITGLYIIDGILTGNFAVAWDAFLHTLLPAIALALGPMVQDARVLRSSLVDNMGKEYIGVSRAFGIPDDVITRKYLLKPSSTPAITTMGLDLSALLGQAFLVERVFNWPGLSRYCMNAMLNKDLNAICACVLIIGVVYFLMNLLVDIIIACVDPRMRIGGK